MNTIKLLLQLLLILFLLILNGCGGGGSDSSTDTGKSPVTRDVKWSEDIKYLIDNLKSTHPNVYHSISEEELNRCVNELAVELENLTDKQIFVELLKLIAKIGSERDGHLELAYFVGTGNNIVPLKFYRFLDGVFVIQASEEYQQLVGAKLIGIEGMKLDEVNDNVDTLITRDNISSLETRRNLVYISPDLLYGLGISNTSENIVYELQMPASSTSELVQVNSILPSAYDLNVSVNLPKNNSHFFLSNSEDVIWMHHFESEQIVYIKLNEITASGRLLSLNELAQNALSILRQNYVARVILDVRQNNGGNNQLIDGIVEFFESTLVNQPDKLIVLTDRQTFSAAGNLVSELANKTNALLVGVPPGGAGSQYGDAKRFNSPHYNLALFVPTRYWQFGNQAISSSIQIMDSLIDMSSQDYFNGIDPLLEMFIN